MKTVSIAELKQELQNLSANETAELCLRLARFKKENKELLGYLLFDSNDRDGYIENVKADLNILFSEVNTENLYFAKKNLRRILRVTNKHIKYTGNKQTEAELLIHFCALFLELKIPLQKSTALKNLYLQQLKKIRSAIATLHEDLQYDLTKEIKRIEYTG